MTWLYLGEEMDVADHQYHPSIDSYVVVGSIDDRIVSYESPEPLRLHDLHPRRVV